MQLTTPPLTGPRQSPPYPKRRFLSYASVLRLHFDKSSEIDAYNRKEAVKLMKRVLKSEGREKFDEAMEEVDGAKQVRAASAATQTWVQIRGGGGNGWGKTVTTARADLEDVAAYFWNIESRAKENSKVDFKTVVVETSKISLQKTVRTIEKLESKHHAVHHDRVFLSRMELHKADKETLVITVNPTRDEATTQVKRKMAQLKTVHQNMLNGPINLKNHSTTHSASECNVLMFSKVGKKETRVEMVTNLELGGHVSREAVRASLKKHMSTASEAAFYFNNMLKSNEGHEEDGEMLAEQLMYRIKHRAKGVEKGSVVKTFIETNAMLRDSAKKYAFLETMLCAVVKNSLNNTSNVQGRAECLEEKAGERIGQSLAISLATNLTSAIAVDEWIHQFPAMQELDAEYLWLRPALEVIGYKLMGDVRWGVKARVAIGAVASVSDLLSDIYVTRMFWIDRNNEVDPKQGYFQAALASLAFSLGLQFLVVVLQNKNLGIKRITRESVPVIFGFKPALDAFRVATGAKRELEHYLEPVMEMTFMKCIELFAEAIPAVLIQLLAIMNSKSKQGTTAVWISLTISAMSAGFISASISYDADTDPNSRQTNRGFYGYVPAKASKRTIVFMSLVFFSSGMVMIRCFIIALLGLRGVKWAMAYIGGDLFFYLIIKLARDDFWYWLPIEGKWHIVVSFMARTITKLITDFTSIVQLRHPQEVGGMYWLSGFVLTMGSLPVAIIVAEEKGAEDEGIELSWKAVTFLIPATALCFGIFLLNIDLTYLNTFWTTTTAKQGLVERFRSSEEDEVKAYVFMVSGKFWGPLEEDIKMWIQTKWFEWEAGENDNKSNLTNKTLTLRMH